ncbi:MAG: hypothetical protein Q7T57_03290, partial [Dehalococcoidales bacterium]|nr:hypothetical protein [Dehalococcoidales bacterium]
MKTGQLFTLYTRDAATQAIKAARVLLFLREGTGYGRAGSLFWSHTNTLTEIPSQKLLLHMILDMRCGKLSPLFLSDQMTSKVQDNRCFTLRTASLELNLEAASHEQREVWWKGIL